MMEGLIAEVRKRNILWNKRNPYYKDRQRSEKEWEHVAENTGFSKDDAKKKWRNLRDQFLKEFKKIPKLGDSLDYAGYSGKWQYLSCLLFLRDTVLPRDPDRNLSLMDMLEDTENTQYDSAFIKCEEESDIKQLNTNFEIPPSPDNDTQINEIHSPPNHPRSKRKRLQDETVSIEEKLLDLKIRKLALLQAPEDENSLFLRSLVPYFKKMDPIQQLRVRTKFQEILVQELSQDRPGTSHSSDIM